jgi:hypothetical protein
MAVLLDIIWQRNVKKKRLHHISECVSWLNPPPPNTPTDSDCHLCALLASMQLLLEAHLSSSILRIYPIIAAVFDVVSAYLLVNANFGDK